MAFNLLVHSDNTFLSSNIKVKDIVLFSKRSNMLYASLIDRNNLFGAYEFVNECKLNSIIPILGVEFDVKYNDIITRLIVVAKNNVGYKNLVKLSSIRNEFSKDSIELNKFFLYREGLTLIVPSTDRYLSRLVEEENYAEANSYIDELKKAFNDIYLGLYRYQGIYNEFTINIKNLFLNQNINTLAMQLAFHKTSKDTQVINILNCIKNNEIFNKEKFEKYEYIEAYLKTRSELEYLYEKDEIDNLNNFAKKVNISIEKVDFSLPNLYDNNSEKLKELAYASLKEKKLEDKEHIDRLEYEFDVISNKGFALYYLIVADYVNFAKNNNIMVGPSRGSGGSSLIAYLLNITNYDPLKYNLLFERFLNPERTNYPDFDIDFEDIKREEVIEYVKNKYGYLRVGHISTFSTFGVKSAIRDVAKLYKFHEDDVDRLMKCISSSPISIVDELKNNEKLKNITDIHPEFRKLLAAACQIEGLKRQASIHAAGMIISNTELSSLVPTYEDKEKDVVIQYDYVTCEKLNLIKMDFLGLKNLTIIDYILNEVNKEYKTNYTIDNYDYDNEKTYKLIAKGLVYGLFQLEGAGMKNVISKLHPSNFEDIVSLISLYRPGPMDSIPTFIENKHNPSNIKYIIDDLKDILECSYGVIVYQEQIMQILQKVAGYTLAGADIFRRAISKKKVELIEKEKVNFVKGCKENNIEESKIKELYRLIYKFSDYGFNRSHAVGYGKITCIMASLKANYPAIFYKAMLNLNKENGNKLIELVNEARVLKIQFKFPSVNNNFLHFEIVDNALVYGLADINSIQDNIANKIINERNIETFNDVYDFVIRMARNDISLTVIEDLIGAGALDEFKIDRKVLLSNIERIYNASLMYRGIEYKPNSYKEITYITMPIMQEDDLIDVEIEKKEFELLGIYISTHPLVKLKKEINKPYDTLESINENDLAKCLVYLREKSIRKFKDSTCLEVLLEDETKQIRARTYNNAEELDKIANKKDVVEVLIKMKNGKYYLNGIRKENV